MEGAQNRLERELGVLPEGVHNGLQGKPVVPLDRYGQANTLLGGQGERHRSQERRCGRCRRHDLLSLPRRLPFLPQQKPLDF